VGSGIPNRIVYGHNRAPRFIWKMRNDYIFKNTPFDRFTLYDGALICAKLHLQIQEQDGKVEVELELVHLE
jgi:hypothetical protein